PRMSALIAEKSVSPPWTISWRILGRIGAHISTNHEELLLAECYDQNGNSNDACELRETWILKLWNEAMAQRVFTLDGMMPPLSVSKQIADALTMYEAEPIIDILKRACVEDASDFWLMHILCSIYLANNDRKGAIEFCLRNGIDRPPRLLLLRYLYALEGSYTASIRSDMELVAYARSPSVLMDLLDP